MKLFLTSSNNFVVKHWIQYLDRDPHTMKLTFIPTAAEVEHGDLQWLKDDRQALVDVGFDVSDFTLTGKSSDEVKTMLASTDMVFVSGGNTFFLLQEMQKSGFTSLIHDYLKKGLLYGGSSAGSVVAGPDIDSARDIDDPSFAPDLKDSKGLGLVDILLLPHWGSEHFADDYTSVMKYTYKKGSKIILLTDDQYLFVNGDNYKIESI